MLGLRVLCTARQHSYNFYLFQYFEQLSYFDG